MLSFFSHVYNSKEANHIINLFDQNGRQIMEKEDVKGALLSHFQQRWIAQLGMKSQSYPQAKIN